jgi:hypothetical protein
VEDIPMIGGPLLLLAWLSLVLGTFGVLVGCVGLVVLLCERSWSKPAGSLGSVKLLLVSALLCAPTTAFLAWFAIDNLRSTGRAF